VRRANVVFRVLRRNARLVAVTASGLACLLYTRVGWPWLVLGWVGLVPWLAVLDRTLSVRRALTAGLLMCEAFVLMVFAWFPSAIQNYTGASWVLSLVVVMCVAPLIEPQFITCALARHLAAGGARAGSRWRAALVGACAYVGTEWAYPKLFADTLGHGLYASTLMRQAADIAGAHGLTFVLLIANECVLAVLQALQHFRARWVLSPGEWGSRVEAVRSALAPTACVAALVVGLLVYGVVRIRQLSGAARSPQPVVAGIVQSDISQYDRLARELGTFAAVRMILDAHFALSAQVLERAKLDFLVWPETVYPTTFGAPKSADGADFDREIGAFVNHAGVPLVFGTYDVEGGDEFNAAVFLQPAADGQVTFATYRKASLFPMTERVPAVLELTRVRQWLPWLGTWKPGKGPRILPLSLRDGRTLQIAPLICYDALDPERAIAAVRSGAELIVTLSNDSWFAYGGVPRLILIISAFRSLETRRAQLRATNTGISAVITPTGEFLDTLGVDVRGTLVGTVTPDTTATTVMVAWGDWFGRSALVGGILLLAASRLQRRWAAGSAAGSTARPRGPSPPLG
jgi:apolipoprotein N-acyltransferase